MYYVYEWFIKNTGEIFYVGKGTGNRKDDLRKRNEYFMNIYNKYECENRIVKTFEVEQDAFDYEISLIRERRAENQAKANFHEGGLGGDVWKYAPQDKKDLFIEKMKEVNGRRCGTEQFKKQASENMKKRYESEEERVRHSAKVREVWSDEELRRRHSETIKQSQTAEVIAKRAKSLQKKVKLELNGASQTFDSRKSMLEYFSDTLNFTPSNHTLAKLFKGEEYKAFRKAQEHLNGMKISYIEEGVETIENLPIVESE